MMLLSQCADRSESEYSLSDGVTKDFTKRKIWPDYKITTFRLKFGLKVCPVKRAYFNVNN